MHIFIVYLIENDPLSLNAIAFRWTSSKVTPTVSSVTVTAVAVKMHHTTAFVAVPSVARQMK